MTITNLVSVTSHMTLASIYNNLLLLPIPYSFHLQQELKDLIFYLEMWYPFISEGSGPFIVLLGLGRYTVQKTLTWGRANLGDIGRNLFHSELPLVHYGVVINPPPASITPANTVILFIALLLKGIRIPKGPGERLSFHLSFFTKGVVHCHCSWKIC